MTPTRTPASPLGPWCAAIRLMLRSYTFGAGVLVGLALLAFVEHLLGRIHRRDMQQAHSTRMIELDSIRGHANEVRALERRLVDLWRLQPQSVHGSEQWVADAARWLDDAQRVRSRLPDLSVLRSRLQDIRSRLGTEAGFLDDLASLPPRPTSSGKGLDGDALHGATEDDGARFADVVLCREIAALIDMSEDLTRDGEPIGWMAALRAKLRGGVLYARTPEVDSPSGATAAATQAPMRAPQPLAPRILSAQDAAQIDIAWADAIAAIASSDRYGGLVLREHDGIVPIGADPVSGLWEFVHLASGAPGNEYPRRDSATGRVVPSDSMGIVLVLLPSGSFAMGAQSEFVSEPNYDPLARSDEKVHRVTLSPFFCSKYEVTRGQWLRMTGSDPSASKPRPDLTLPVEQVSWNDCTAAMRQCGLKLLTESQWEYAARAATMSCWWTGPDDAAVANGAVHSVDEVAPVGSKAANAYGLYDTAGNVWEWCLDSYGPYPTDPALDLCASGDPFAVRRGGCYYYSASFCRSANRNGSHPTALSGGIGLRAAFSPVLFR